MSGFDRRRFLKMLGTGAVAAGAIPASIERALAIPARRRTGTIADVEHIVILTQENRSFDHYFGTLAGVRGFGDPRAARLPGGNRVWFQPDGNSYVLPFHPSVPDVGSAFFPDPPHGWNDGHDAWNGGSYDRWVANKGRSAMSYLTRRDLPYHFALAEAFTVCDAYHCSLMGPTDPNRYHMWSGWVGNDGKAGGPVITNAELGYDWSTYPERLEKAGVSWKVYQDVGVGLTAPGFWGWTDDPYIGNYGDNSLLYFHQYQNAPVNSPLALRARTGTNIQVQGTLFDILREDVAKGRLPQVSYIAAPEAYSEHPNWPSNYGAWYISQVLDILTADPDLWSRTVFLINYDEDGGFFDHMIAPTPAANAQQGGSTVSTQNEFFPGDKSHPAGPYGLGVRVPLIAVSPWSRGGYVNSQVLDHTSVIRFLEARFAGRNGGLVETNITAWRRAVAGDLTSVFNFDSPNDKLPRLPSTVGLAPKDRMRHPDDSIAPPARQVLPLQDRGVRRARALPYELSVCAELDLGREIATLTFENTGDAAAVFQVRSANPMETPRCYTVEPRKTLSGAFQLLALDGSAYDLEVHGPNGFFRAFRGGAVLAQATDLDVRTRYDRRSGGVTVEIENEGHTSRKVSITDRYTGDRFQETLAPGKRWKKVTPSRRHFGWYDLVVRVAEDPAFEYVLAGHVETGRESISDPAMAGGRLDDCELDD